MEDLVMLGGEPGQGLSAELAELFVGLLRSGQPRLERGDLGFEPGDLSFARIGDLPSLLKGLQAAFELDAEVSAGAGSVERGAVDGRFAGEGLDVALSAGRDLSA
ncbi:hypothetical protein [Streptomyces atroolivaceus]|uniref:hypothetical protein n=1 Tax=Streptomyces atroolivaceus TaxID=66869 RepID=UPI0036944705